MDQRPFSASEANAYWIGRQREYKGHWKSTGFQGGSQPLNQAFYACRLRALKRVLTRRGISLVDKRVLDVGCGLGDFARYYCSSGAQVFGIDISPDAVEHCNSQQIGTFVQGEASEVAAKFDQSFDLIHCFDVLYHLTDELEWQSTLAAFAQLSGPETLWLFTEFRVHGSINTGLHLLARSIDHYRTELALYSRQIVEEVPLYWLYIVWPWVGKRSPWLIPRVEWLGHFVTKFHDVRVALWVIEE